MIKYLEMIYYFVAFTPGVTVNIFMILMLIKYRNAYIGYFSAVYLGTSLLVLCYLANNFMSLAGVDYSIRYMSLVEAFSMSAILLSASILIIKIFYDELKIGGIIAVSIFSLIPIALYGLWFLGLWKTEIVDDIYYIVFIIELVAECVLFLTKFHKINHKAFRKLGVAIVLILSLFMVFFIVQIFVPSLTYDLFPLLYLLVTYQLITFGWKNFIRGNIDEVFNVKQSFIKKYGITNREQEIIELIQLGDSNSKISKKLFLSEKTVANHIYNIYKKLNITSRFELICLFKK